MNLEKDLEEATEETDTGKQHQQPRRALRERKPLVEDLIVDDIPEKMHLEQESVSLVTKLKNYFTLYIVCK